MAGIGWRLERLINQGIAGATAAYATGAAVMALPWVLTTIVLATLPTILGRAGADTRTAEIVLNVAYAVALLVSGPVQVVVSRYTADRIFQGERRAIAAPLCRGLGATFILCFVPTALALLVMVPSLRLAALGAALSAAVGAQWTALSVGNGLCTPSLVLGGVAAGSVVGFVLASVLVVHAGLGVPGYLFGLTTGQIVTLVILLVGILRALPVESDEHARLLPAFRDYAALATAGLAFNAALWVDKLVAWTLVGGGTAALHGTASTLAWLSAIPCLAWIFVEVETAFHRRYRRFYRALEGGASLTELRLGVHGLVGEAMRLLRGAASVQLGVTLFLQLATVPLVRALGLPDEIVPPLRLLLVAAGVLAIGLLGMILLYYFDLRREACLAAVGLFFAITLSTAAATGLGLPPSAGTILGCVLGATLIWQSVFGGIRDVLSHTLLGQPFGAERGRAPRAKGS